VAERLEDLSASFARHLRAEGRADRTGVIYAASVRFFAEWLAAAGRPATLDELSRSAIREWLAGLVERGQAPGTVRTRYKGLHRFCTWLVAEGELSAHPMIGLDVPAVPDKPVPLLSDEDLTKLIKACAGTRWYDRRDEAVVRFLLDTGVRVSELTGLSVADVDLDHEMALVLGKGRKLRPVYFSARTSRALDRWLRERRKHQWSHLDAFFLGERGALGVDGVRELVRVRGEKAGLPGVHPHRFRHSFAHDFLLNGGQERDLMRLAGWSSDAMLQRYGSAAADLRAREAARRMRRGDRV
jgi:site-specific recombinase XerD